jgi:glycosyltransferase involved in cell wall biosynthesis
MVESMACGTPVLATRYGAVPEVIEEGRSGVIVDSPDEMPAALEAVIRLDPAECRMSADERFSASRMVADYVRAYERLLEGHSGAS